MPMQDEAESRGNGASVNEHHLHATPASSLTEELQKITGGVTTVQDKRGTGLDYLCYI